MTAPSSVWLVGLSGAGKSAVGPLVSRRLGWDFVDLDAHVVARAGEPIPEIFRRDGEARFRRLEAHVTARLAGRTRVVVATGGGWMARSDLERSGPGRIRVWLRVDPAAAAARLAMATGTRPLVSDEDPGASLARMLADRRRAYAEAEVAVETDGRSVHEVAEVVLERLRRLGVPEGELTGGPGNT